MTDHPPEPAPLVLTTANKLDMLIQELSTMKPDESAPEARSFVTGIQMLSGMGIDLMGMLRPDDPADCALMVDQAIRLLFQLRGDDLPPFDASNYGELAIVAPDRP